MVSDPEFPCLAARGTTKRSRGQNLSPVAVRSVVRSAALHLGAGNIRVGGEEFALAHILNPRDIVAPSVFPAESFEAIL